MSELKFCIILVGYLNPTLKNLALNDFVSMYLRLNAFFFSFPNVYYWWVRFPFYSDSHFPFLYSRGHIILPYRVNGSFMLYFKSRNGKITWKEMQDIAIGD